MRILEEFRRLAGGEPQGVWRAPGRVNLIGEHTDYNQGLALPFALDRATLVAARGRDDGTIRLWSLQEEGTAQVAVADLDPRLDGGVPAWCRYPLGVAWALREAGVASGGADLLIDSDVPVGSGLSSSASLELAAAAALAGLAGADLPPVELAGLSHRAETDFVGAPVGLLDQLAIVHARAAHATLIDFRSMEVTPVPLDVGPLVVVDSRIRHAHAGGEYRDRRRSCEEAAAALGVESLRDATAEQVEDRLEGELRRRARHIVTENERVTETVRRLRAGEPIGDLLYAAHASMRDDFEASCEEIDVIVETASELGASGARLTGGGFGGCAIVLGIDAATLEAGLAKVFADAGWSPPVAFSVEPSAGPQRLAL